MRLSLLVSSIVFCVVGGSILLDQWIIGASAEYILGTTILIIGICVGLFATIAALGLAISAALPEGRTPDSTMSFTVVPPTTGTVPQQPVPTAMPGPVHGRAA